jgi:pyruvate formate lyase activating enzyme
MKDLTATPLQKLEKFAADAKTVGLRYPYIGEWGSKFENTYCYNCRNVVIERTGSFINKMNLDNNRCPNCGFKINIKK